MLLQLIGSSSLCLYRSFLWALEPPLQLAEFDKKISTWKSHIKPYKIGPTKPLRWINLPFWNWTKSCSWRDHQCDFQSGGLLSKLAVCLLERIAGIIDLLEVVLYCKVRSKASNMSINRWPVSAIAWVIYWRLYFPLSIINTYTNCWWANNQAQRVRYPNGPLKLKLNYFTSILMLYWFSFSGKCPQVPWQRSPSPCWGVWWDRTSRETSPSLVSSPSQQPSSSGMALPSQGKRHMLNSTSRSY